MPNDMQIVRFDGGRAEMAIGEQDGFIYIDGSKDIGYLDLKGYRESAPIRLEVGDKGHGLTHIELRHGDEIRSAGFESVEHFIKYVADNYTEVRKAKDGNLMLDVVDGRSGKAMLVQLQPEGGGSYWGISTAGIFNKRYINSFDKVVEVDRTSQQQVRDDAARFRTASSLQVPSLGKGASVTTNENTTTTNLTKQEAMTLLALLRQLTEKRYFLHLR